MITRFDKNKVPQYFKERFVEASRNEEYEKAIDYLLKYSELTDYPEFHLAMGELYLMMTQDSDDIDLCFLAYREFLMHIRRFPKCTAAYRGLIATEYLRRDFPDVEEYRTWFEKRGINVVEIFKALSRSGLALPISDEPIDLYELLAPGDLGELDWIQFDAEPSDADEPTKKKPGAAKIIKFDAHNGRPDDADSLGTVSVKQSLNNVKSAVPETSAERKSKIIDFDKQEDEVAFEIDGDMDDATREILDEFMQYVSKLDGAELYEDDDDGANDAEEKSIDDAMLDIIEHDSDGGNGYGDIIKVAGDLYDRRNYEDALKMLSRVRPNDPQYYYALTLRGVILLERYEDGDIDKARAALDEALKIKPGGALASTLICQVYELSKTTELIPGVLKAINNADFVNGAHVYKAFDLALEYCSREDAIALIEQYIDEYNLMDMRLIHAQMMYNDGRKTEAIDEFYTLSRINYDDIHYNFFYLSSKLDVDKLPEEAEAPQEILAAVVENIMSLVLDGTEFAPNAVDGDLFLYGLEFFFTLEFKNSKKTLKRMFNTLSRIAANPVFEDKARDALVSPYAEPIVKGVILSELFSRKHDTDFLVQVGYKHYSDDSTETPKSGYGEGVYRAYGMLLGLCPSIAPCATEIADRLDKVQGLAVTEQQKQYYIVKRALKEHGIYPDDRLAYAMCFGTKSEADRAYSTIDKKI